MTSSTTSNSIIASLARNTSSHRSVLVPRSMFRSRPSSGSHSRRVHHRRVSTPQVMPVTLPAVDVNNNSAMPVATPAVPTSAIALDRVAILKAFAASQAQSSGQAPNALPMPTTNRGSRFEKPTSYREARRQQRQHHHLSSLIDPAIDQEFVRLRDSVPSIAGSNVSDLTIINEAISLICDLESQLIRKLKCQKLPVLPPSN